MDTTKELSTQANEKDACNEFWDSIQSTTGLIVPSYIRNILKLNGFNSVMSLRFLDEEDLNEIENFVKSGGMLRILPSDANLNDFYGPFLESRTDFQFLRGHRKVLKYVSSFVREKETEIIAQQKIASNNDAAISEAIIHENDVLQTMEKPGIIEEGNSFSYIDLARDTLIPITSTIDNSSITTITPTLSNQKNASIGQNKSINTNSAPIVNQEVQKISVRRNCVLFESSHLHRVIHKNTALPDHNTISNGKPKSNLGRDLINPWHSPDSSEDNKRKKIDSSTKRSRNNEFEVTRLIIKD